MSAVIHFEQVSKRFTLHHERPRSFQELAVNLFRHDSGSREHFWALQDVSFTVDQGETVGLIGPNGAGKSTALKLISRIIEPTSGRIEVNGRVGALLELGTGFHPDLTGRENIYLNGSILGLKRSEISQRLESIIEFAELSRFIDMAVRNYSSGMLMRLGFAVATSFRPDILLIDEILAVGDQAFQDKCIQRITGLKRHGVTILFVSHDLDTVRNLCDSCLWLDGGQVQAEGSNDAVITAYLEHVWSHTDDSPAISSDETADHGSRWGSGEIEILDVRFYDTDGEERRCFETGECMVVKADYVAHTRIHRPVFGMAIHREDGVQVNEANTRFSGYDIEYVEGQGQIEYDVNLPLLPGTYYFSMAVYDYAIIHPYDHREQQFAFQVRRGASLERYGVVCIPCQWRHVAKGQEDEQP